MQVVEEGFRSAALPSLARAGPLVRLGALPGLVSELARALGEARGGGALPVRLADHVREHARVREAAGFAPGEVVRELVIVRRVLGRLAAERVPDPAALDDLLDGLLADTLAAYVDDSTAELVRRARLDPLTGLLNHRAFNEELEREVERGRRYGGALTLVYLDVDGFKAVNDTLGHGTGDRVLRAVARALRQSVRASDLAGRPGGDEFAAVLLQADAGAAGRLLGRLDAELAGAAATRELPGGLSLSAGVARYPEEAADGQALLALADARLLERKRKRRRRAPGARRAG